jgi:hypothetical protein
MQKLNLSRVKFFLAVLFPLALLYSCATVPGKGGDLPPERQKPSQPAAARQPAAPAERPDGSAPTETAAITPARRVPPEQPPIPPSIYYLRGSGKISPRGLAAFFMETNPGADAHFVAALVQYYREEAAAEGINHDIAFAQMCLETGFLRYGGLVTPEMNNFCGLGAIGPEQPGAIFPSPRIGVRAHSQHLKAYATDEPLRRELVDPRYRYVRYGSAPTIEGLAGTWAVDREYAVKIRGILERMYEFTEPDKPAR